MIFVISIITLPLIQNIIFYWGINLNSFRLAFSTYESANKLKYFEFGNFRNIINQISALTQWKKYIINAYKVFFLNWILYTPWVFFVSYFVYKFGKVGKLFKVVMFAPSLISPMVSASIYLYFCENAVPEVIRIVQSSIFGYGEGELFRTGLFTGDVNSAFWTIMLMGFFTGMGSTLLIYVNAMSGISESVVESAKIDGVGFFTEFFHITFPMIFPMWKQLAILGFVGILGGQFGLFEYYGTSAPTDLQTLGYYLYIQTIQGSELIYPELSALGLMMTAITIPTVLIVRRILDKLDPMEN